jgi:hypothetical protein
MTQRELYEQFAEIAFDDDEWFFIATDLQSAAEALEPKIKEYWEVEARRRRLEKEKGTILIFEYQPDPRGIYFMLVAYALENLCKAFLIKKHEDTAWRRMVEDGEIPKEVTGSGHGHDLETLLYKIGFPLTPADKELAFRLERSAVWSARYPVPKKAETKTVRRTNNGEEVVPWHKENDLEVVKEFVARVERYIVGYLRGSYADEVPVDSSDEIGIGNPKK